MLWQFRKDNCIYNWDAVQCDEVFIKNCKFVLKHLISEFDFGSRECNNDPCVCYLKYHSEEIAS